MTYPPQRPDIVQIHPHICRFTSATHTRRRYKLYSCTHSRFLHSAERAICTQRIWSSA
jgi:hypothetical protein